MINSTKETGPLRARNFNKLLYAAIKRHRTIFSDAATISYSRIEVEHWDGSRFDVHGAVYEYSTLTLTSKKAVFPNFVQKMLIV